MSTLVFNVLSFALCIVFGIALRKLGLADDRVGHALQKIVINITLPALVIVKFTSFANISPTMLLLAALGFVFHFTLSVTGLIVSRNRDKQTRAFYALCTSGACVGSFTLPFITVIMNDLSVITTCLFDVGNAFLGCGGNYAFVSSRIHKDEFSGSENAKKLLKNIFTSIPLMTYLVMFILSIVDIHLPEFVTTLLTPAANANAFISMLMIGVCFRLDMKKEYISDVVKVVALRLIVGAIFSIVFYFLTPLDISIKQSLVLDFFTPVTFVSIAYVGQIGGDEGKASCANSLSVFCSLIIYLVLPLIMLG